MHRHLAAAAALAIMLACSSTARAQNVPTTADAILTPLRVVITVSRFDGDRRISSLPYTVSVIPAPGSDRGTGRLRMGTQVPIPSTTMKDATPTMTYSYRDVGTNIDITVRKMDGERYRLEISFEDAAVFTDEKTPRQTIPGTGTITAPSIRSFSVLSQVVLKDGQTVQFNVTPDKVTGEIIKLDASLTVMK